MTNQSKALAPVGLQTVQTTGETAAMAVAAQAKASIEARWMVAVAQPRNLETVRQELLKECQRPSFAATARYKKPIGQGVEGLSIRFVEAALQVMGNCDVESVTIYDDPAKRIVEVRVTDYQKNVCHRKQITIDKTVERKQLRQGQVAIDKRTNSAGQTTYLVEASEDDLLNKEGALTSKAIRTCGLRIIPGWLQDEAEEAIQITAKDAAAKDPDAERRKLLDAFGSIGVYPEHLEAYLAHPISQVVEVELVDLRTVYQTIQAGEATWADTLAHRQELRGEKAKPAAKPSESTGGAGVQSVKDALAKKAAKPAPTPTPTPAPKEPPPAQAAKEATPAPSAPAKEPEVAPEPEVKHAEEKAAHAAKVEKTMEAKAEEDTSARPSRSKAAQAVREKEIAPWVVKGANDKVVRVYIENGDPRNLEKAQEIHANQMSARIEAEAKAEAAARQAAGNVATAADGTQYDKGTGEVQEETPPPVDEEPEWMRNSPPPGEGF